MGKQGPCCHCGVTNTPLWRNGPPDKPILCNACGSRWRTKGSLVNYTPLHSRPETNDFDETKVPKRKRNLDNSEDGSNRSSSGSAVSNYDNTYAPSDPIGPLVWDSTVPSRKRTCVFRPKSSCIEKLTKDLYAILQEQQASFLSDLSEESVLLETNKSMVSVEIGHGSVLIKHPSSLPRESESESSSLSVDNKFHPVNQAYSRMKQDQPKRDLLEKLQLLGHHNSPLRFIGLKDVVNFDLFVSCLTSDEQLQMRKYLPSVDTSSPPESLKSMFESTQYKETVSSFQKLLGDGVFDNSLSGATSEDCRMLKRYILCNLAKSKWVEQYSLLKDPKCKGSTFMSEGELDYDAVTTCHSVNTKKVRDVKNRKYQGNNTNREAMENDESSFGSRNLIVLPPNDKSKI